MKGNRHRKLTLWITVYSSLLIICGLFLYYKLTNEDQLKSQHLYIAASYLTKDSDRKDKVIRMLAAAEGHKIKSTLFCQFDELLIRADVQRLNKGLGCKWQYFFIECKVDRKLNPMNFNLTDVYSTTHEVRINEPYREKHKLVVCFSRAFFFEKWQSLILALHHYRFYGVDHLVIPIVSVIKELFELLEEYEKEGYVRLKPALMIPKISELLYDPNEEIDVVNQVLNFDNCLYEYKDSAEFMAFVDFDDLIQPQKYMNIYDELKYFAFMYPNAASFEFQWPPTLAIASSNPNNFNLDTLIRSFTYPYRPEYGKSIIRPQRIRRTFIHHPLWPKIELTNGYDHKFINTKNATLVLHVRHFIEPENAYRYFLNNKCLEERDNCLYKNASFSINKQFHLFLANNLKANKTFNQLPSQFPYYEATINCPRIAKFGSCYSPYVCRPPLSEVSTRCVVVDAQEVRRSLLHNKLHVYSVLKSRFVKRENCLPI